MGSNCFNSFPHAEQTVEMVIRPRALRNTLLKQGVNEMSGSAFHELVRNAG
jgi:hypothetical protein